MKYLRFIFMAWAITTAIMLGVAGTVLYFAGEMLP